MKSIYIEGIHLYTGPSYLAEKYAKEMRNVGWFVEVV